jgi:putative membrane protein
MQLIRAGNLPAAVSLGGAVLGFALAIGSAIAHSASLLDAAVWGFVALLAQLAAFGATARLLLPGWRRAMERGELSGSVLNAAIAVAVGLLNAACLTP